VVSVVSTVQSKKLQNISLALQDFILNIEVVGVGRVRNAPQLILEQITQKGD
jgi:hypothetical protein